MGQVERSHWGAVAGFALVSASNQMVWLNFAPITTGAAHRLHVSSSTIGVLSEVFPLLYVVLALPVGRLLDRWFRPTLLAGAACTAAGALLRLAGHGFAPVLAGQLVVALAQPAVLNAVTGVATRSLVAADRVSGIAVGSAGTFVGFVVAFVLGLVLGATHLQAVLDISAAIAVGSAAVLAAFAAGIGPVPDGATAEGSADRRSPTGRRSPTDQPSLREVWADPVVRSVCAIVFVGFGVFVSLTTWEQTLLSHYGVSARAADVLLTAMVVAGVVTAGLAPGPVARRSAQATLVGVAAAGGVAACALLAAAPGVATGAVALVVVGIVLLPVLPALLELLEAREPAVAGVSTGLLWLAGNAGGIVVALLVQAVVDLPPVAWSVMAAGAGLAIPLAVRLGRQLRPAAPVSPRSR